MAAIVLRVSGKRLDVDACLVRLPAVRPSDCYRAGEPQRDGSPHSESGFTLELADEESDAIDLAQRRLRSIAPQLEELLRDGATGEVDCGIFVFPMRPAALVLAPTFLKTVTDAGLDLRITAYPSAGEE